MQKQLKEQIPEEYRADNQLMRAMDALKAIKIYRQFGLPSNQIPESPS